MIHNEILKVLNTCDTSVGIILGARRKGKSVLGYGILETLHNLMHIPAFALGLPADKESYLPKYITPLKRIEGLEDGSALLVDEAYKEFYSRQSMSQANKSIDTLVALSGQKQLKSLYITQHARRLEIGIVGGVDYILIKKPSLMQMKFDRHQLRGLLQDAYDAFQNLNPPKGMNLGEWQKRCTYVVSEDYVGLVQNSNTPPLWWTDKISNAYAGIPIGYEPVVDAMGRQLLVRSKGRKHFVAKSKAVW